MEYIPTALSYNDISNFFGEYGLNEMYSEVREHLRRQHAKNTQEIHGKRLDNFPKYSYYGESEDLYNNTRGTFSLKGKILLFLLCVMLFSCYLYGGQDIKKGATLAWNDLNTQITQMEKDEPAVQEAMGYCRQGYRWVKSKIQEYIDTE